MHLRDIEYASPEYEAACDLRHRFLRLPLGLELTPADKVGEESQLHFGLFVGSTQGEQLIGALIGKPLPDLGADVVQLRQVVVCDMWRGRGAGRRLMDDAEAKLHGLGYQRFVLFARTEAAPFYERCRYVRTGETCELIGLKHWRMEKRLTP